MPGVSSQNFLPQEETRSGKPYGKLFETVQRLFTVLTMALGCFKPSFKNVTVWRCFVSFCELRKS